MLGDPCRPQAQGDRCDRRSVRPLHPAWHPRSHPLRQRTGVRRRGVQEWIAAVGTKTAYIERGSPWENGYIESFNARLRDELLNGEIFYTLRESQIVIESWRRHYNIIRPHASPSDTSHQHQRYSCVHLPPRSTLFDYLDLWSYDGTLDRIHHALYVACREQGEREASPSAAIVDSQSVKSAEKGGPASIRMAMTGAKRSRARSAIFS